MPDLHVLPGIWTPVKGYDTLLARLRSPRLPRTRPDPAAPPGNLLPVAYDWRLSCRYNGQRLATIIEPALQRWRDQGGPYADAQVVFVCHSMGGLIARWYIEQCGGAEITRKLITLGTPYRGAARALGQLVNGAHHGLGPLRLDLTRFARSMPSLHQLLPEYACLQHGGDLAKTTDVTLPELDTAMVADAMRFHTDLRDAEAEPPGQPGRHPRHRGHHASRPPPPRGWPAAASSCSTPTRARTWPGTPPCRSSRACRADVADGQQHAAPGPGQARQPATQPRRPGRDRRHPDRQQHHRQGRQARRPAGRRTRASRWPARPSPSHVTPAEPTRHAIRLAVTSETGTLVEARRAPAIRRAGHHSTGSRPARTPSTSPAPAPPHRSRRSAATSSSGKTRAARWRNTRRHLTHSRRGICAATPGLGLKPATTHKRPRGSQDPYGNRSELRRYPDLLRAWARIWHDQAVLADRLAFSEPPAGGAQLAEQPSCKRSNEPGLTCEQARLSVTSGTYSARHDGCADSTVNAGRPELPGLHHISNLPDGTTNHHLC